LPGGPISLNVEVGSRIKRGAQGPSPTEGGLSSDRFAGGPQVPSYSNAYGAGLKSQSASVGDN